MIYFDYEKLANDLLDHMVEMTSPNEVTELLLLWGWDKSEIIKLGFDKQSVDIIYKQLKSKGELKDE
jgi:hypothetical protein